MNHSAKAGFWNSPISAESLASKSTRLGHLRILGDSLYWLESRPEEQGRGVIVRRNLSTGSEQDITPPKYSIRSKVHEMGGGDFWGNADKLVFVSARNQSLYEQDLKTLTVRSLVKNTTTNPQTTTRFTDGDISPCGNWTICVRESHHDDGTVVNDVVSIELATGKISSVAKGNDFYSNPRFSPVGSQISWLTWSHPNMPWDSTRLYQADYSTGGSQLTLDDAKLIAGDDDISIYSPQWSAQGDLFYVSDKAVEQGINTELRFWSLYSRDNGLLHHISDIEFGLPQWIFGTRTFDWLDETTLIATGTQNGSQSLYTIDLVSKLCATVQSPLNAFTGQLACFNGVVYGQAASASQSNHVFSLDLNDLDPLELSLESKASSEETSLFSVGKAITFPVANTEKSHAFYYAPLNMNGTTDSNDADTELPPLIVISHGGPTGMTDAGLDLNIQFWTSRGFAVVDVNYRGSTGFGREYREKLKGQWGIADVEDCIAVVDYLANQNLIDRNRVAIRGGSAGGFTTLSALTFHDIFKVGMSRYGVADLTALAEDTHKFEERYLDSMVGSYPEFKDEYIARSPINHVNQLSCPLLILQGLDDKIVPPNQSEAMANALEEKGIPYKYLAFEGEGHGFRKPETIIAAFTAELEFYQEYLLQ